MKPPANIPPLESTSLSWADVIQASASPGHEPQSSEEDGAESKLELSPGDLLMHEKFGACTIHQVTEDGVIHMARETGRVIRLRQDMLSIRALGVECRGNRKQRIFTTHTEQ